MHLIHSRISPVTWLLLAIFFLASLTPAFAAFDPQMYMVKATTAPIIDGNTSDWAFNITSHSITGATAECAKVRMAYNASNLYLLYEVQDNTPLLNTASDHRLILKGGDCVGLTIGPYGSQGINTRILIAKVGGAPVIEMLRPTAATGQTPVPYTYSSPAGSVTMQYVNDLASATASCVPVTGGYVIEASIPWSALGITPVDGASLPADAQVIFSNPSGTLNDASYWWNSTGSGPTCTTDLPTEAQLYPNEWTSAKWSTTSPNPRGGRVVILDDPSIGPGTPITVTLPSACKVSLVIKDSNGWIVRELVRARSETAGVKTYYWDGRDRLGKLCPAGNYTYLLGYFNGPTASFYGSVGNSGHPPYRTPNGLGSIGGVHGGPKAVAADAGGIYMMNALEEGQKSGRKVDINGNPLWFYSDGSSCGYDAVASDGTYAYVIYSNGAPRKLRRLNATTGAVVNMGSVSSVSIGSSPVSGMAVTNGRVYYTVKDSNKIGVINIATGAAESDISITGPSGIFASGPIHLLICSGSKIVKYDVTTDTSTDLVTTNLVAPAAVTGDSSGTIYVADGGSSQQIKKFNSTGVFQNSYGVAGGRTYPQNIYNPLAFRNVTGLCLGPDSKLYGVEQLGGVQRFFCMTTGGLWQRDFYGPTGFATVIADLDDPTSVYYQTERNSIYAKARINYGAYAADPSGNGTWSVEALYNMTQNGVDTSASPDLMASDNGPGAGTGYKTGLVFTGTNGKRYFWLRGTSRSGLWIWTGTTWRACAATRSKSAGLYFSWSVGNGDGLVQGGEYDTVNPLTGNWIGIDRDLKLFGEDGTLAPASIDAAGVPHYQGGSYTPHLAAGQPTLDYYFSQNAYSRLASMSDTDGSIFINQNCGAEMGQGFWDRASEARLLKVKGGVAQWIIGKHNGTSIQSGDVVMFMGIAGVVDGVVLCSDIGSNFMAYSTDGLTLGNICTPNTPTDIYVENASQGIFYKDPITGKRLLLAMTTEDVRVLTIDSIFGSQITRQTGNLSLTTALPVTPEVTAHRPLPYSTWAYASGGRFQGVDGFDWEWAPNLAAAPIYGSNSNGLTAKYYAGTNFDTLKLTRTDPNIAFNWGTASPDAASGVPIDNFTVRWSGLIEPLYSETYTFSGTADDRFRVWVNNSLIVDKWTTSGAGSGTINLQAGQKYPIVVEFKELTGSASLALKWASASQTLQTIPTARLFPAPMIADTRLRRDAGNLCMIADVLDTTPFPAVTGYATPADYFGHEDGVELLLGPPTNPTRTTGAAGDIRIFLTAKRETNGTLTGYAYACKPNSIPVPTDPGLRKLNKYGAYVGTAPSGSTDFSSGFVAIPGAMVAVVERTDRQGYSLEAEIPWAAMREIARQTSVTAKRQDNNTIITDTRWDMQTDPIKFNTAVHLGSGSGAVDRFAWVNDGQNTTTATLMNPSTWGWANDQVTMNWPSLIGATGYNLYRGSSTNPALASQIASNVSGNSRVDSPGVGTYYYWLAAVTSAGEGQWYGPIVARDGIVNFSGYTDIAPYSYSGTLPTLGVYMGKTQAVNLAVDADTLTATVPTGITVTTVKRSPLVWTAFISATSTRAAGSTGTVTFIATKAGTPTSKSMTVLGASVWTDAYMVRGVDTLANIPEVRLDIDSTKPANGAAGLPAANMTWGGTGFLTQRALGTHGYVLPLYRGVAGITRNVKTPFVDTFTTTPFGNDDGFNSMQFWTDGISGVDGAGQNRSGKVPANTAGSSATVRLETTDTTVTHRLTVCQASRNSSLNPAMRFDVKDLVTNQTWPVAEFDNTVVRSVVQFEFTGVVNLTVVQTQPSPDGNRRANIAAILLD